MRRRYAPATYFLAPLLVLLSLAAQAGTPLERPRAQPAGKVGDGSEAGSGPCDWITVPVRLGPAQAATTGRTVTTLPLDHARYRELVGEAIGEADVQLTALARVDLQGDGTDEVLFAAESHPSPGDHSWPCGA